MDWRIRDGRRKASSTSGLKNMTPMDKNAAISLCMASITASRAKFRGQPDTLQRLYWDSVSESFSAITNFATEARNDITVLCSIEMSDFLLSVARSGAIRAVRDRRTDVLDMGLIALAVENAQKDYRETLIELSLLDNSAKKTEFDTESSFLKIRDVCGNSFRDLCDGYLKQQWRSIDSMGYREACDRHGQFTYSQVPM